MQFILRGVIVPQACQAVVLFSSWYYILWLYLSKKTLGYLPQKFIVRFSIFARLLLWKRIKVDNVDLVKTMNLFRSSTRLKQISLLHAEDFTRFYEEAHPGVFRYVMVLCAGNQSEAEDITSEAFFRAWDRRTQFTGTQPAAFGWVITIAKNCLIDHRRSENLHPVETLLEDAPEEQNGGIEDLLVDKEQFQQVLDAVQNLPFQMANIFTLRYVIGWRVKAIAEHLEMAENTVSVDLRRASARLQQQLYLHEGNPRSTK